MFGFIFFDLTFLQHVLSILNFKCCSLKANGNAPIVRAELILASFTSLMYHSNGHIRDSSLIKGTVVDSCPDRFLLFHIMLFIIPHYMWW